MTWCPKGWRGPLPRMLDDGGVGCVGVMCFVGRVWAPSFCQVPSSWGDRLSWDGGPPHLTPRREDPVYDREKERQPESDPG